MRHQDLRRPREIESLWLHLRLLAVRLPRTPAPVALSSLSDHQLQDIGLVRREPPTESVTFWLLKR